MAELTTGRFRANFPIMLWIVFIWASLAQLECCVVLHLLIFT